ncbi:hypothetical protein IFM89_025728 [Coptis chinensis]|uniref:SWIM-type domain-containing protein n=1 Tax=Coptis chinensis TaxID=261450 RepID=A0A835I7Z3_9MAGN|nr:hypothetical protein IFM89_025728 [Coptis chinensis]
MRHMEIATDSLYKAKLMRGFCHLYDGQKAVAIGMEAAITKKDVIITAYRDHCLILGHGGSFVEAFSELIGRKDGCSKGKGGSMHFYKKEWVFWWPWDCWCSSSFRLWLAFAQKYKKDGCVTFALYGDGAANQGQLFEALNMAALWDLPTILVCKNNHYEWNGTAEWRAARSPAYYKCGDYAPGLKVGDMDSLAVKQACKFAKEYALSNGPIVVHGALKFGSFEMKKLNLEHSFGFAYLSRLLDQNEVEFEVEDVIVHYVNVERRSCSCRYWQIDGFPYVHAVASIITSGGSVYSFIDPTFTVSSFSIHPIANIEMPIEMPEDCDIMPPDVRRGLGKPKKKRIESTKASRRSIHYKLLQLIELLIFC